MNQKRLTYFILQINRIGIMTILMLILTGCIRQSKPTLDQPINEVSTKAPVKVEAGTTITPSKIIESGNLSTTPSIIPTALPTSTLISSETLSWEPTSALPFESTKQVVSRLLENNGDCELPCWFGIVPGVTKWMEARKLFQTFAEIADSASSTVVIDGKTRNVKSHAVGFEIPGEERKWGALLVDQDEIVSFIRVDGVTSKRGGFILSKLLSEYGEPDQIYLRTTIHVPSSELPFRLVLYYKERNILVDYNLIGKRQGQNICAYPQSEGAILWLWSDNSQYASADKEFPEWALSSREKPPIPIDQVTDFAKSTFYQTFVHTNNTVSLCTSIDKWP